METLNINSREYEISFVDTQDTIRNMVALYENTLPEYVKYTMFDIKKNVQIKLLSDELTGLTSDELLKHIGQLHKDWKVSKTDLALEWLDVNQGGVIQSHDIELLDIFKEINSTDFWGVNAIITSYKNYQNTQAQDIQKLARLVEKEKEYRQEFAKYTPLNTTNFLQDSVIIEYQITINLDPLEAFDSINLNSSIPFARLKTGDQVYYKLQKTLVPQKVWLEGESTLTFKIYRPGDKEGWGTATIDYTGITEPFSAVMTIETSVGKGEEETTEDAIKNNLVNIFTGADIKIIDRKEKGIKGLFAIPEVNISRDVFLDLITNDPMVSHYLYVDETRDLSSQKGVLYLYYSPGESKEEILTVFLSERVATRSDIFYTSKELLLFTPYLNVRISRATDLVQIERFMQAFAVILNVYKKRFSTIAKAYEAVIPGFKADNELVVKKSVKADKRLKALQEQDSELFIHGYPTSCEQKRQPIPVDDPKKWREKGRQVMNYPTDTNNFYICSDENEFRYPGLMKNKLNNSDMYPYLPCCYPKNQRTGKKLLNLYLKGDTKSVQAKTSNIVIKKAVGREKLGQLPRNIHYILNKEAALGEEFLRQGVEISNNSFIEVVLLALDPGYEKPNVDKSKYTQDVRNNLASQNVAAVIQELYDLDAEKITRDILNLDVVFDSKLFTGLLEAYYNCQIIVFERTETQPNGEYEIPRYTQGYLYNKIIPTKKTVLVYKHIGIRSDSLETPHYELIIKKYKKLTTWHFENETVIRNVYSYFLQSYKLYVMGVGRYAAITIPPDSLADAKGQMIDRYGKTRGYTFDNNIYMAVSPLAPAADIDIVDTPSERPSWRQVKRFINSRGLVIISQDISENVAIGVAINFPGIPYAYIPFKPTQKISGVTEASHLGFSVPTQEDILRKTLANKKIADFMMQLMLYAFSLWYADQEIDTSQLEKLPLANQQVAEKAMILNLVDEYLTSQIVIIPNHFYDVDRLPRRLSINNKFFQNNKLVVDSEETYKSLNYYLRFMVTKNKAMVLRYSERRYLDNYYTYADDFQERKGQLIFVGGLSISNWIETQEHGISNQTHSVPHPQLHEPFFFSHWALGAKPVIFQNVKNGNFGRALAVAAGFVQDGINIGYNAAPKRATLPHSVYFLEEGVLKREGASPIKLWRFAEDYYAAIGSS